MNHIARVKNTISQFHLVQLWCKFLNKQLWMIKILVKSMKNLNWAIKYTLLRKKYYKLVLKYKMIIYLKKLWYNYYWKWSKYDRKFPWNINLNFKLHYFLFIFQILEVNLRFLVSFHFIFYLFDQQWQPYLLI